MNHINLTKEKMFYSADVHLGTNQSSMWTDKASRVSWHNQTIPLNLTSRTNLQMRGIMLIFPFKWADTSTFNTQSTLIVLLILLFVPMGPIFMIFPRVPQTQSRPWSCSMENHAGCQTQSLQPPTLLQHLTAQFNVSLQTPSDRNVSLHTDS